jgi:hypothetical protein
VRFTIKKEMMVNEYSGMKHQHARRNKLEKQQSGPREPILFPALKPNLLKPKAGF